MLVRTEALATMRACVREYPASLAVAWERVLGIAGSMVGILTTGSDTKASHGLLKCPLML